MGREVKGIKNLLISGYRSFEMNIFKPNDPKLEIVKLSLKKAIIQKIEEEGLEWVITSGQLGVELWAIQVAIDLRNEGYSIKSGLLLPYKNYGEKWNDHNKQLLEESKNQVDFCNYSSSKDYFSPRQLQANQEFIIRNTDGCLLVYDEEYEGKPIFLYKAVQQVMAAREYRCELITFDQLEETAREEAEKNQDFF